MNWFTQRDQSRSDTRPRSGDSPKNLQELASSKFISLLQDIIGLPSSSSRNDSTQGQWNSVGKLPIYSDVIEDQYHQIDRTLSSDKVEIPVKKSLQ